MTNDRKIFVLLLRRIEADTDASRNNNMKRSILHIVTAVQPDLFARIRSLPPKRQWEETASVLLTETGLLLQSGRLKAHGGSIRLSEAAACEPIRYSLQFGSRGKPYFVQFPSIFFSISHSGAYAACAFSQEEVGLDLQTTLQVRNDRILRLSRRFFSPDDHQALLQADAKNLPGQFTQMWAAHEAYVKFTGEGLHVVQQFSTPDHRILRNQKNVANYQFLPAPDGYCMAVCGRRIPLDIPDPIQIELR